MDLSSTCVDSAMEVLGNVDCDLSPHAMDQVWALFLDLKFFRTFLLYTVWFNDTGEDAALGSLLVSVEAALTAAAADLRAGYEKGNKCSAEHWGPEISKLQKMIQLFKPEIENGYERLSLLIQAHSCPMDYRLLNKFVDSVMEQVIVVDLNKIVPVEAQIEALKDTLGQLAYMYSLLAKLCSEHHKFKDFLIHLQAVIFRAARLSYLCWIRRMDGDVEQVMDLLCDLKPKIKPNIPEIIDMYLEVLKASKNSSATKIMKRGLTSFLDFLLYAGDHKENLLEGLKSLVTFFIDSPEEFSGDAALILKDIRALLEEAAALHYSFDVTEEILKAISALKDARLLKLLRKIKLVNAEVSLMKLLKRETRLVLPVRYQVTTLQKGLRLLTTFFMDLSQEDTVDEIPIWTYSEEMATRTASLCHSIHANETKELIVQEINFKLAELLMEILKTKAPFVVSLKDKIESLQGEMRSLRIFLTGPPEEYEEKAKPALASGEAVARKTTSLVYSLYENRMKEGVDVEMDLFLSGCLEEIKLVNGQVKKLYIEVQKSWLQHPPTFTDKLEFFDFLLGSMKELLSSDADYVSSVKPQIEMVQENFRLFRSFLKKFERKRNEDEELNNLRKIIMDLANEAEGVINTLSAKRQILWYCAMWLSVGIQGIEDIKMKVMEITEKKSRLDDSMVDLKDEEEVMRDQLFGGSLERNIVSIVGMPGLGKSTLANKIYNDPQVKGHFLHAWSCVSQKSRREMLLDILSNNFKLPNNILAMTDDDLCEELYICLKDKRYLVVLDDLRSISAWYSIRQAFPDDQNGSRVLITTRFHSVALRAKRGNDPLPLRLLSDFECWRLLRETIFGFEGCPEELLVLGNKIAKSCKGLPLAVVTIGRVLKRKKEEDHWKHLADGISSTDNDPQKQLMKILELSYIHLPNFLKPCFLYFGAFLEGKEIAVWRLITVWIAEGLVRQHWVKSLENVVEEYLLDLIDRGLIIVAKRRSNGQVKTCRIHDMVRILCLTKAKSENFFHLMLSHNEPFCSSSSKGGLDYCADSKHFATSTSTILQCCRLCIHSEIKHFIRSRPSGPAVKSLLCFEANGMVLRRHSDISFICHNFKVLTVLYLECMLNLFPIEIGLLVQLRYLAVKGDINDVPSSIGNLTKLETFLLKGSRGKVSLPTSLWRVAALRHVYVDGHFNFTGDGDSFGFGNLISLATPVLSNSSEPMLQWYAANIRKLRCIFEESQDYPSNGSLFLSFLINLETLKIFSMGTIQRNFRFGFPMFLRSLTLSGFCLPWYEISAIGRLPNLETLKLLSRAFEGHMWNTGEEEFWKLKFLKLDGLDIRQWNASEYCFPVLQRLVLRDCKLLEEVPSVFGEIPTLEMIEVKCCRHSAVKSVKMIFEKQQELGNEWLRILISESGNDWDWSSSF